MTEGGAEQTISELLKELGAAEAAVAALGPTPEEVREEAAEAERLAKENGMPAKTAKVITNTYISVSFSCITHLALGPLFGHVVQPPIRKVQALRT